MARRLIEAMASRPREGVEDAGAGRLIADVVMIRDRSWWTGGCRVRASYVDDKVLAHAKMQSKSRCRVFGQKCFRLSADRSLSNDASIEG